MSLHAISMHTITFLMCAFAPGFVGARLMEVGNSVEASLSVWVGISLLMFGGWLWACAANGILR